MKDLSALLSFSLLYIVAAITVVQCRRQLRYAVFTTGPKGVIDASGAVPAMELAEEYVFNSSALKDYELKHSPAQDTLCDRTRSLDLFFATVAQADPPVLGLLGCGCSVASEPVAEIIHHWNISQIAYDSAAIVLSESRFVNFFRTYPSDESFAPSLVSILKFYDWNQILFITEEEQVFIGLLQNVVGMLSRINNATMSTITNHARIIPNSVPLVRNSLNMTPNFFFTEEDIRVIFINTYSDVARIILCEAMRTHGLSGYPRYVWITYAWYQDQWWTSAVNGDPIRCSDDELSQLLVQSLAIEVLPVADDPDDKTKVGVTEAEFEKLYRDRLQAPAALENNYTFTSVAPLAYDAVWSLALALNATDGMLNWPKDRIIQITNCQDDGTELTGFRLDDFTYNNSFVGCVIRWNLAQTDFVGVSGRVTFDSNGSRRQAQVTMLQYRAQDPANSAFIQLMKFGQTNENDTFVYVKNETDITVFPDGVPSDGTPIEIVSTFHTALVVIYYFLAVLGLIFTTVCFVFNFVFRNRKVVRLTSPNLNYFIIAGSSIMYASIFIRLIPSTDKTVNYVRCNLQVLLTTVAYCLAFGTILVKVGRVYHIFNNPTEKKKKALKDWHMAVIVLGITGVGVLMAVLGWSIPRLRALPSLQADGERQTERNELGVKIIYMVWQCSVNRLADIVSIVIFSYLGLLQIIGIILAIQTRKVKVKVLNDSKYIAALIYISSIVLVVIAIIRFTLGDYINVTEIFYSGGLLVATTAFLSLTFIPKMVSLKRDPLGENIFSKHTSTIEIGKSGALTLRNKNQRVSELEARVKELEDLLRENECNESICTKRKSELVTEDTNQNGSSTQYDPQNLNIYRGRTYASTGQRNLERYSSSHSETAV